MLDHHVIITPSKSVELLKQQAKRLKAGAGVTHTEALERVAREAGYLHWKHVTLCAAVTSFTEDAYRSGLILAFEPEQGRRFEGSQTFFVRDYQAQFFCERDFRRIIPQFTEPDEDIQRIGDLYGPDELEEIIRGTVNGLLYFRYTARPIPLGLEEFEEVAYEAFYSGWEYVWIRGRMFDSFEPPYIFDSQIVGAEHKGDRR